MVGWEQETFQVDESVGQARICLLIRQGTLSPYVTYLAVDFTTRDGTASRGDHGVQQDYIPEPVPRFIIVFQYDDPLILDCINVPIIDDTTFDSAVNETFYVDIRLAANIDRVTISPSTVLVSITDNESK